MRSSQCIGDESTTTVGWISRHDSDDNIGRSPILIQTTYAWAGLIQHYHSFGFASPVRICICRGFFWSLLRFRGEGGWPFVAIETIFQFNVSQEMTWHAFRTNFSKWNYLLLFLVRIHITPVANISPAHTVLYTLRFIERLKNTKRTENKTNKTINDKTRMHHEIRMNYSARTCYRVGTAEYSLNVLPGVAGPRCRHQEYTSKQIINNQAILLRVCVCLNVWSGGSNSFATGSPHFTRWQTHAHMCDTFVP